MQVPEYTAFHAAESLFPQLADVLAVCDSVDGQEHVSLLVLGVESLRNENYADAGELEPIGE